MDENEKPHILYALIFLVVAASIVTALMYFGYIPGYDFLKKVPAPSNGYYFEIVSDPACSPDECKVDMLKANVGESFPGYESRFVSVFSERGKNLTETFSLNRVPVIVFRKDLLNTSFFLDNPDFQKIVISDDENFIIPDYALGSTHFIDSDAEIRFYAINMKVLAINPLKMNETPQFDFFIMSYCPYCIQLESSLKPVYDLLKNDVKFYPRYLFYEAIPENSTKYCEQNGQYCSLHGVQELRQGVRELCVFYKLGADEWYEFSLQTHKNCDPNNVDSCWEVSPSNLDSKDIEVVKKCVAEEGLKIMRDEQRVTKGALKVEGTPTMYLNGKPYLGARDPQSLLDNICKEFSPESRPGNCNVKFEIKS